MSGMPGYATAEGTARYAARFEGGFRRMGDVLVSSIGIGTYLGEEDDENDTAYDAAVRRAIERGANVIDTAINYRSQRSERAVGRALRGLIEAGQARRDEIVVATKGGYIPFDGERPPDVRAYFRETFVDTGILGPGDVAAGCHSIAPRYLDHQLARSRENLGLDTIDVYYLHNPEQQLDEVPAAEFILRMRRAFEFLESCVAGGRIRRYGAATWNGFRSDRQAPGYLSLAYLEALAREVGGRDHHFRVIQLPYNLAMTEAFGFRNQNAAGAPASVLEAARGLGITVMASSSMYQGHLTRGLPEDFGKVMAGLDTDAQRALQFVRSTPGVAVALVGMKGVAHVEENLALLARPAASPDFLGRLFEPPAGAA